MALKGDARLTQKYKRQRLKVLHRDGYICFYCGGDAEQVDHVIPVSKQGDAIDMDNMVAACKRCNVAKGNRSQGVFLQRTATPPVFPDLISPSTTSMVQPGPAQGQPEQHWT